MPATINKQRLLTSLLTALKKNYDAPAAPERPVLEEFLYAVLRENSPRNHADRAFRNLQERFYDWNEVRVSSPHEVAAALDDLPQPLVKAQRIIDLLQEIFESTFGFELDTLIKKGIKQGERQVARYQASSDFAVAWVMQRSLDGHAMPLDAEMLRTLKRLGMIDESADDVRAIQQNLEHQVPKAKGLQFIELLGGLAHDRCGDTPRCNGCALKPECLYASTPRTENVKVSRPKSR
jgi:endonuclease-3